MATAAMGHSMLGIRNLVGVSGAHLAPATRGFSSKRDKRTSGKGTNDSSAIRALSDECCSSSSIVVPGKSNRSRRSGLVGSIRSSAGKDEFRSGRASFPVSSVNVGVQLFAVRRYSGSATSCVPADQNIAKSQDDSHLNALESAASPDDNLARPQPIVQGFADSPFVDSFSLDLTAGAVGGNGTSEFDSMSVSAMPMYQPKFIWFAKSAEQENMIIDRVINATIVGSAGAIAMTKVLTVDHDYWQGWTLVEILKYAPVHNWFAYEELLKSSPVLAKMMISGTVYSLGDWIAQCYEGKPILEFNRTRMLRSGLVGFCLHGSMSHFYYQFCEWLFPFQGWWVVPLKVGFDQTCWSALWNSIYFVTIGLLRFESPVEVWKELRSTFFPLLTAGWKLWPFAHLITYGVVPVEQRLLWVDLVEIVWVTILAMISNEKSEARIAEAEAETVAETKELAIEGAAEAVSLDEVAEDENSS